MSFAFFIIQAGFDINLPGTVILHGIGHSVTTPKPKDVWQLITSYSQVPSQHQYLTTKVNKDMPPTMLLLCEMVHILLDMGQKIAN